MTDNNDFNIAFNAHLLQAKVHGVDTNDETIRSFLQHTAEVTAHNAKLLRDTQHLLHNIKIKESSEENNEFHY